MTIPMVDMVDAGNVSIPVSVGSDRPSHLKLERKSETRRSTASWKPYLKRCKRLNPRLPKVNARSHLQERSPRQEVQLIQTLLHLTTLRQAAILQRLAATHPRTTTIRRRRAATRPHRATTPRRTTLPRL